MTSRLDKAVEAFSRAMAAAQTSVVNSAILDALGTYRPAEMRVGTTLPEIRRMLTPMEKGVRNALVRELDTFSELHEEAAQLAAA